MAYWKKIKNTNAVPVLKDDLVFDQTPTVNSTNPVTSDGVARAIAGASGEVPVVTENDNGKVLTAVYDEGGAAVEWASAPNEVPAVGENDNAKVLTATYSEGTGSFAWSAAPSELPDTTGASQGDVLSIGSSGLEWATPSGGSGVPEYSASDEGKVLGVVTEGVEETPALGWVEPPAGSVVIEYNGNHIYTAEECAALVEQVSAAITANKPVFVCDESRCAPLSYTGRNASYSTEYRFVRSSASTTASPNDSVGNSQNGGVYRLSSSSFTFEQANIRSLPNTVNVAGKVLSTTDYNGTLAWVDQQDTKYTAGNGISIEDEVVSIDHDSTLSSEGSVTRIVGGDSVNFNQSNHYYETSTTTSQANALKAEISAKGFVDVSLHFATTPVLVTTPNTPCYLHIFCGMASYSQGGWGVSASIGTSDAQGILTADLSHVTISTFDGAQNMMMGQLRVWISEASDNTYGSHMCDFTSDGTTPIAADISVGTYTAQLSVAAPVPSYDTTTDVGKVLTVTANGLEWVLPA